MKTTQDSTPIRSHLGLGRAVASEWLKLRTVRSTWWLAGGLIAVLVATALLDSGSSGQSSAEATAFGAIANFGQFIIVALGAMVMTAEFASRSITVTLACTPVRTRVMAAKAMVTGAASAVLGVVASATGILVGALRFGELDDLDGGTVRLVLATGVYLGFLAVISLGVGTLLRRTAGTLALLVFVMVLVPELLRAASQRWDLPWLDRLGGWTPAPAGYRVMDGDWEYVAALAVAAVGVIAAAIVALRRRDA